MKSFLIKIAVFTIGLIALIVVPVVMISSNDNTDKNTSENHNIISLQIKSSFDNLDILFVGNSYCYSAINTEYLDSLKISSFNLGIATAGVQFYELVTNDYFKHTTKQPKQVLLLVSPMTFSSKSDNFDAYPIHRYLEDELSNFTVATKFGRYDEIISMYRKSFKKALTDRSSKSNKKKDRSNTKGYFPSDQIVDDKIISEAHNLYLPFRKEKFNDSKVTKLLEIAKNIEDKGSEVIFFEVPTNILSDYFSNDYLMDYEESLESLKGSFELLSINKSHFSSTNYRNIDHMNSSGATIATREIVKLLGY